MSSTKLQRFVYDNTISAISSGMQEKSIFVILGNGYTILLISNSNYDKNVICSLFMGQIVIYWFSFVMWDL